MECFGPVILGRLRWMKSLLEPCNRAAKTTGYLVCRMVFHIQILKTEIFLVARKVSEDVSAGQCQYRWQKALNPKLRKGAWTEDEDNRLRKAVAVYGSSWIQVAETIPGRTNDQCRDRWTSHLNKTPAAKATWTKEEDKALLALVKERGKHWKDISSKIGTTKNGQSVTHTFMRCCLVLT